MSLNLYSSLFYLVLYETKLLISLLVLDYLLLKMIEASKRTVCTHNFYRSRIIDMRNYDIINAFSRVLHNSFPVFYFL